VRAGLADAEGRPDRATAERRSALRDLQRYQALLGSFDLRTAVSSYGRRLAAEGLARALATGRTAAIFEWAERARALSSRLPAVTPPADPEAAKLLEELRQVRAELREQLGAGPPDPVLSRRRAELERQIRQRAWYLSGEGRTAEPPPVGRLQEQLAPAQGTLVAHLVGGRRVHVLVVGSRRRAVWELGPVAPIVELQQRAHADLDTLAMSGLPTRVRATVSAAAGATLRRLDSLLFAPARGALADGPLLLVPAAGLVTVPWSLLPTPAGRPVTVVPSATSWLALRDRARIPADPFVALAAGPRIARGADELRRAARQWTRSPVPPVRPSTTAEVRAAAQRADVLHVAAHGTHEPDNPLFSYLELADGPLFGHELALLPQLPRHVVLSACDLALAETRPGDETLGMTAALLHSGVGSVVAGVGRVSDAAACELAAAHHAGLNDGLPPAAALARAQTSTDEQAPLVCFGAGW
jgi:hypothetical protein